MSLPESLPVPPRYVEYSSDEPSALMRDTTTSGDIDAPEYTIVGVSGSTAKQVLVFPGPACRQLIPPSSVAAAPNVVDMYTVNGADAAIAMFITVAP